MVDSLATRLNKLILNPNATNEELRYGLRELMARYEPMVPVNSEAYAWRREYPRYEYDTINGTIRPKRSFLSQILLLSRRED